MSMYVSGRSGSGSSKPFTYSKRDSAMDFGGLISNPEVVERGTQKIDELRWSVKLTLGSNEALIPG